MLVKKEQYEKIGYHKKQIETTKAQKEKLELFLKEANEWNPPTAEHLKYQEFMIDQIRQTIKFDVDYQYHEKIIEEIEGELKRMEAGDLRRWEVKRIKDNITYHETELAKEVKRVEENNKWVEQIYETL